MTARHERSIPAIAELRHPDARALSWYETQHPSKQRWLFLPSNKTHHYPGYGMRKLRVLPWRLRR